MRVENGRVVWSALGAPTIMFGDDGAGSSPQFIENIRESSWPYGPVFDFGIRIAGAVVTVYPGHVEVGGQVRTSVATDITIDAAGQFIGLELDRNGSGITITGPHDEWPVSSDSKYRTALYTFDFQSGVAWLLGTPISTLRFNAIV